MTKSVLTMSFKDRYDNTTSTLSLENEDIDAVSLVETFVKFYAQQGYANELDITINNKFFGKTVVSFSPENYINIEEFPLEESYGSSLKDSLSPQDWGFKGGQ